MVGDSQHALLEMLSMRVCMSRHVMMQVSLHHQAMANASGLAAVMNVVRMLGSVLQAPPASNGCSVAMYCMFPGVLPSHSAASMLYSTSRFTTQLQTSAQIHQSGSELHE